MPLLLTALQYRFDRDVDAMARHLIDGVTLGWYTLGTDLLDGAPPSLVTELTGGTQFSSTPLDGFLITTDGSPPTRNTITPQSAVEQDFEWGYVLRPDGIEVISVRIQAGWGPLVPWDTDPRTRFSDHPAHWAFEKPLPVIAPARPVRPTKPAPGTASRRNTTRR
ncbi:MULTISPECIES: hypothetical protein [Streptomyces]|uniref:hypothetical protein n=1 Tax=Streptomyces TaxID=1883 RepID=UPI0027DD315C|nr:hypothetical protein [Streptomyces sp. CRPSP2-6A1]